MALTQMEYTGGGVSIPVAETETFTIASGTPVTLNFDNPHSEFFAVRSDGVTSSKIYCYIMSDALKGTNSGLYNWYSESPTKAGDSGGYEWSNGNKTLTLTMPRNYYGGTYTLVAM